MTTTSAMAVSLPHSDLELEALLPAEPERLLCGLAGQMHDSALCADQDLGHMEEQLLLGGHEVFRQMLEKGAQLKAEQVVERLAVVKISAATLARQALQEGQRAEQKRKEMDGQMSQPEGRTQQD